MRCCPGWITKYFEIESWSGESVCDFGNHYVCKKCNWKRTDLEGGSFAIGTEDNHYNEALMDMKCHLIEEHGIDEKRLPLLMVQGNPVIL